jgi:hypothetical protein
VPGPKVESKTGFGLQDRIKSTVAGHAVTCETQKATPSFPKKNWCGFFMPGLQPQQIWRSKISDSTTEVAL